MKKYEIIYRDKDYYKKDIERGQCSLPNCLEEAIGLIQAANHDFQEVRFCSSHEEVSRKSHKRLQEILFPLEIHVKLKFFDPQPIPADLKKLAEKNGWSNLKIYAIDYLSLDGFRAVVQRKKADKEEFDTPIEVSLSEPDEN